MTKGEKKRFSRAVEWFVEVCSNYDIADGNEMMGKFFADCELELAKKRVQYAATKGRKETAEKTGAWPYSLSKFRWMIPHGDYAPKQFDRIRRRVVGATENATQTFNTGVNKGKIAAGNFRTERLDVPSPIQLEEGEEEV